MTNVPNLLNIFSYHFNASWYNVAYQVNDNNDKYAYNNKCNLSLKVKVAF